MRPIGALAWSLSSNSVNQPPLTDMLLAALDASALFIIAYKFDEIKRGLRSRSSCATSCVPYYCLLSCSFDGYYAAVLAVLYPRNVLNKRLPDSKKGHGQAKHTQVSTLCCRDIQAIVYEMPVAPYPGSNNIHWPAVACLFCLFTLLGLLVRLVSPVSISCITFCCEGKTRCGSSGRCDTVTK